MKQYLKCLTIVALVATFSSLLGSHKATPPPKPAPAKASIKVAPAPAPAPAPAWAISAPVAGVPVSQINQAVDYYQKMGLSKQGTAYLVGNFIQENRLQTDSCAPDGGAIACGLASWHEGRRADMPLGEAQFGWAVNTEMARHSPALKDALYDPNASVYTIIAGIKSWEGYGIEGARYQYGQQILNMMP